MKNDTCVVGRGIVNYKGVDYIPSRKFDELQKRIDKAIEYCDKEIRNIIANFDYIDTKDLENIRKILKGDDENEK